MSVYTWGWIIIIGAGLILEGVTLLNRAPNDTLSSHVWRLLRFKWFRVLFVCGFAWLIVHFAFGGWV